MIRRPANHRSAEAGSVAVEFALILGPLLFLIVGATQFGLVFWNWNSMLLAVEEAGRYAMLYNAYPNSPPGCTDATPTLANARDDVVYLPPDQQPRQVEVGLGRRPRHGRQAQDLGDAGERHIQQKLDLLHGRQGAPLRMREAGPRMRQLRKGG
jgi:hypothetical protein